MSNDDTDWSGHSNLQAFCVNCTDPTQVKWQLKISKLKFKLREMLQQVPKGSLWPDHVLEGQGFRVVGEPEAYHHVIRLNSIMQFQV